jgi:hypothetical protein
MDESSFDSSDSNGESKKERDTKNQKPIEDDGDGLSAGPNSSDDEMGYVPGQPHPFRNLPRPDALGFRVAPGVEIIPSGETNLDTVILEDAIQRFWSCDSFDQQVAFLLSFCERNVIEVLEALQPLLGDSYETYCNAVKQGLDAKKNTISHQYGRRGGVDYGD